MFVFPDIHIVWKFQSSTIASVSITDSLPVLWHHCHPLHHGIITDIGVVL